MGKIKTSFVFFDGETEAKISDNDLSVNGAEAAVVSVEGAGEVEIQGIADLNSEEWTSLGVINKSDFSVGTSITEAGIYSCSVDGYWKIRAEIKSASEALSVRVNLV